jgi:Mycothiol maleylpyruvate isomerase N-terminal domain
MFERVQVIGSSDRDCDAARPDPSFAARPRSTAIIAMEDFLASKSWLVRVAAVAHSAPASEGDSFESLDAKLVRQASSECTSFLDSLTDRDWTARIPDMDWDVSTAIGHAAAALIWYSMDLRAGVDELMTPEIGVKPDSDPRELVRTIRTASYVLASVIENTGPEVRGFHGWGMADASGFRGMACDELLVHTDDAARGLGTEFSPSPEIARITVERLFPWAHSGEDPWATLKWANGRGSLPDRPKLAKWHWHCAPVSEWDGVDPTSS